MRLNKETKQSVINALGNQIFNKAGKSFLDVAEDFNGKHNKRLRKIWQPYKKLIDSMVERLGTTYTHTDAISYMDSGLRNDLHAIPLKVRVSRSNFFFTKSKESAYAPVRVPYNYSREMIAQPEKDAEIQEMIKQRKAAVAERAKVEKLIKELIDTVSRCSTSKQLLEVLPEAEEFLPREGANLPVCIVSNDLRQALA